MVHINSDVKNKIIRLIKAIRPDVKIYVFGSVARQQSKQSSDIDIALLAANIIPRLDMIEIKDVLHATNIPTTFDIIDLNEIDPKFKNSIKDDLVLWSE